MQTEIKIPFGYKRVEYGLTQRGDGMWNGHKFVRVKRVKRKWQAIAPGFDYVIRRCEIKQVEMPLEP